MEDNKCSIKYIEIVPLDNVNNCSDVTHIKQEPDTVKVYVVCIIPHYFYFIVYCRIIWDQYTTLVIFYDVAINVLLPLGIFSLTIHIAC